MMLTLVFSDLHYKNICCGYSFELQFKGEPITYVFFKEEDNIKLVVN